MAATTGPDLLLIGFESLSEEEQEEAFERIAELRAGRLAGEESEMARFVRSLRRVAEEVGDVPSVDDYRHIAPELRAAGEDIEPFSRLYRYFGSWRRAREALTLSETTTARKIEARFRARRVGKVWRYTDDTLRETVGRCVDYYGRVPMVSEFEWWRDRELELARAEGNDALHLPSPTPYRRRYGSWEQALLRFGYTTEQLAERLERP